MLASERWIIFSLSPKGALNSDGWEARERDLTREISRNGSNLWWVTDEVTTGHGTDTCPWHPGPHVRLGSWNLIYWDAGCGENSQPRALPCWEMTACSRVTVLSFISWTPLAFEHLTRFLRIYFFSLSLRRLAGNDLSFIHPEAMSGLHQLKVL